MVFRLVSMISIILSLFIIQNIYASPTQSKVDLKMHKAQQGDPDAKLWLCSYYYNYNHEKKAYHCLKDITRRMSPHYKSRAYNTLGLMYRYGDKPVSKNYRKAEEFFKKAINLGYKGAYINLAAIYNKGGHGIHKDVKKAKQYYQLRARTNDPSAKFGLGNLYANQNQYKKAFHWYHQAAKQYYLSGMYVVGILYAIGKQGVRQNKVEGCKWFRLALKVYPDYQKAHYMLGKLMPTMDYTQKYACHQAVKKYLKHHDVPRKSNFKARLELKS